MAWGSGDGDEWDTIGGVQNRRRQAVYDEEMEAYRQRQERSQDAALGMGIGAALAAPIPVVGPFIAAGLGAGAGLVSHYGPGDEPAAPEFVPEIDLASNAPYRPRSSRAMASDPGLTGTGSDPYAMMAADQGTPGYQVQAIQDLRRRRQQRLAEMMAPQPV